MNQETDTDIVKLANLALQPDGVSANPNQLIRINNLIGRRDTLTEIQQRIVTAALSLAYESAVTDVNKTQFGMEIGRFASECFLNHEDFYKLYSSEIEKILKKGLWLFDETGKKLTRTAWFQAIEYSNAIITFQFSEQIIQLIAMFAPGDADYQLVKGLQYKGKHTLSVFDLVWQWKGKGVIEYSIPQLMEKLSLEHTRYSYGQLKLRVLEPSFEEIYVWDDAIFVRFGPTFSGRRVEGVWFELTVGEEAKELRKKEPVFKVALPEQKPIR